MIARVTSSDDPTQHAFVPLRFHSESSTWLPIGEQTYASWEDALAQCFGHLLPRWTDIFRLMRILRVLVEHRSFHFENDGLDHDMVRDEVHALVSLVERFALELPVLLREPGLDEPVRLDGLLVEVEIVSRPDGIGGEAAGG